MVTYFGGKKLVHSTSSITTNDLFLASGLPSEPGSVDIEYISDDSVTLHWTRPGDTGGVPLSGYVLEIQEFGSSKWKVGSYVDSHHTSHTLSNLKKGTEYSFRVRAENPTGAGPPRTLIERVVPKPQARKCTFRPSIILFEYRQRNRRQCTFFLKALNKC